MDALGWPAIFLVNVPIGAVVWLLGQRWLPREAGPGLGAGLDPADHRTAAAAAAAPPTGARPRRGPAEPVRVHRRVLISSCQFLVDNC
jgi:hypothetical protein